MSFLTMALNRQVTLEIFFSINVINQLRYKELLFAALPTKQIKEHHTMFHHAYCSSIHNEMNRTQQI